MKIPRKYLKITAYILASILVLAIIGGIVAYTKRETILSSTIDRAIKKAKRDYNLNVKIGSAKFAGLSTVVFKDITVVPDNRDSLAMIHDLRVGVKLFPLIFGSVKLAELTIHNGKLNLVKHDSVSNYDFLFRKKREDTTEKTKVNLTELANNLLNKAFNKVPDDLDIRNFEISFTENSEHVKFNIPAATIKDGDLRSTILVNNTEAKWHINGAVEPGDKQFDVRVFAEGKKMELPFLERRYKLKLNFDTIHAEMSDVYTDGDGLRISGKWAIKNLLINHAKIAANDIVVPDGSIDANLLIGEDFLSVDSSSVIHLKNIRANPYIKYTIGKYKKYELKLSTAYLDAQSLFNAFPQGLFESLEGIKVTGQLRYGLNFNLDTKNPDKVQFESRLDKQNFKILGWGKTNLQKINSSFVYTPYEFGKPMRDITIGPANPNFTPLDQISSYLKNAVLTAEDPSFYNHHGFVEESMRKSIATNFKEKAFKRGGSTISMQLVKNIYLSRQKTVARKIEEILIVWLIENNSLSSKSRMFETYLNLIEWGYNVYGIGEASRYYFDKNPADLTLGESIFMASIVPRPKKGLYFFESDGSIRQSLHGYFRLIGGLMARKGYAEPDSSGSYGFYSVRLKESLRRAAPADSLVADSTLLMEDDDASSFLRTILGPKKPADSIHVNEIGKPKSQPRDTVKAAETPQTPREKRRAEREARRREKNN